MLKQVPLEASIEWNTTVGNKGDHVSEGRPQDTPCMRQTKKIRLFFLCAFDYFRFSEKYEFWTYWNTGVYFLKKILMTLWLGRIGIEEVLESFPVASNNKWEAEPIRRKFERYTKMKLIKGILTYFFYMYGGIRAEPSYNWRHYTIQDWF